MMAGKTKIVIYIWVEQKFNRLGHWSKFFRLVATLAGCYVFAAIVFAYRIVSSRAIILASFLS